MITRTHNIKINIYQDYKPKPTYIIESGQILGLQLHQSIDEGIGTFSINLAPNYYSNSFYRQVKINAFVNIWIDDLLRMQGILLRPKEAGQMGDKPNRTITLWGYDLGHLVKNVNKTFTPLSENYIKAEAESLGELANVFKDERFIKETIQGVYRIIMSAVEKMAGGKYKFGDGNYIDERFGSSGENLFAIAANGDFFVNSPLSIQLMQPDRDVYSYVQQIADTNFSEVFCDTFASGDKVVLGQTSEYVAARDGFRIVVRPKMHNTDIDKLWDKNIYYDVGTDYYEYSAMKDATNLYNYFVVGNAAYDQDANVAEATGIVSKLNDSIIKYGFKPYRVNVTSVWGTKAKQNDTALNDLTYQLSEYVLKAWWNGSDDLISGQLSFPFTRDARIGRKVRFKLPKDASQYEAYTNSIDIIYDAEQSRMHNVITYTWGHEI